MIRIEDFLFWIVIFFIVGISLWLLSGSPGLEGALVAVGLSVATSEVLLWKKLFSIDKKTAVGFVRVSKDFEVIRSDLSFIKEEISQMRNFIERKL